MTRNAGRGTRHATLALAIAAAACAGEKPGADSSAARPDSVQPATNPGAAKATDPAANAAKATGQSTSAKTVDTTTKTGAKTTTGSKVLGRDSVHKGPIVGVPSIVDTAKRRPPQ